jgi:hypothetical protein
LIEHLTEEQQTELYNLVTKQLADQKQKMLKLFEYWDISRGAYILSQEYRNELKKFIFTGKSKGLEFEEVIK